MNNRQKKEVNLKDGIGSQMCSGTPDKKGDLQQK